MKKGNKRTLTYILIAVAMALTLGIGALLFNDRSILDRIFIDKTEKTVLQMGDKFYQDFYYPLITNGKSQTQIANTLGEKELTVPISEIVNIAEIDVKSLYDSINKKPDKYDWQLSTIKIKALPPYAVTDYEIKADLVKR